MEQLIKRFKNKLGKTDVKYHKYIIYSSKVELDPNSKETISSKGIKDNETINVRSYIH